MLGPVAHGWQALHMFSNSLLANSLVILHLVEPFNVGLDSRDPDCPRCLADLWPVPFRSSALCTLADLRPACTFLDTVDVIHQRSKITVLLKHFECLLKNHGMLCLGPALETVVRAKVRGNDQMGMSSHLTPAVPTGGRPDTEAPMRASKAEDSADCFFPRGLRYCRSHSRALRTKRREAYCYPNPA